MKDKINLVFEGLQELDIKATPHNVSIMNSVFLILKEIHKESEEIENVRSSAKDGEQADLGGRDDY